MKEVLVMGLRRGAALGRVAANSKHLRLAGVIDPDGEALRSVQENCGLPDSKLFRDFRSAVAACDAHILVVATPNHLHAQHVIDGLRAGLHVLCEKPLSVDRDEAERLREESLRYDRQLAVIQNYRFAPHYRKCKQLLAAGEIGRLNRAEFVFYAWRPTASLKHPHALLFNHGVHHLDMLRYVTGAVARDIAALEWDPPPDERGGGGRFLRFTAECEGGFVVCYDGSYAEAGLPHTTDRLRLSGTRGTLEACGAFEDPRLWLWRNERTSGRDLREGIAVPRGDWNEIDRHLVETFAQAIETGQRIETDIEDNLQTLDWLFRAVESIERGDATRRSKHSCEEQS
jgi:predicted dehydrogenase